MTKTISLILFGFGTLMCLSFIIGDVFFGFVMPYSSLQALAVGLGLIVMAEKFFDTLEDK